MRKQISSGSVWESQIGYVRAVKVENRVYVSGTTAVGDDGNVVGENNAYQQTQFIYQKIENALIQAGATRNHIVRSRIYLTCMEDWQEVGKAQSEFFADTLNPHLPKFTPACTMVEVSKLIRPDLIVEIEVEAVILDY